MSSNKKQKTKKLPLINAETQAINSLLEHNDEFVFTEDWDLPTPKKINDKHYTGSSHFRYSSQLSSGSPNRFRNPHNSRISEFPR